MPIILGPDATEFISLAEVKAQANVTGTRHDDELETYQGAAQDAVEALVGAVRPRTVTEVHRSAAGVLLLRESPVLSVTSVTDAAGSVVTGHTLDAAIGVVDDVAGYGHRTVTYRVGRSVVPDAIRVAALIIAVHLWETQRGSAPATTLQGDEAPITPGLGYSIPNRALDLLRPYLLPVGAA